MLARVKTIPPAALAYGVMWTSLLASMLWIY